VAKSYSGRLQIASPDTAARVNSQHERRSESTLVRGTLDFCYRRPAFVDWIPLSIVLLLGIGFGTILVLNLANAIVQTATPDHLRGRVMGAYTWIFFGFMPLGALWTGTAAEHLGEPDAIIINALLAMAISLVVFFFIPRLRQQ